MILTGKEQLVYQYLQYRQEAHYMPTVREIGQILCLAPSSVRYHLQRLEEKGKIVRISRSARDILLCPCAPLKD